jgi:hypothetical protein
MKGFTLELVGSSGAPHGMGARVELNLGDRTLWREVASQASPLSSCILPVHFGVGTRSGPFRITIHWDSGRKQEVSIPRSGRAYRVQEGTADLIDLSASPPQT